MNVVISRQGEISAISSHIETMSVGYRTKKIPKKTYADSLDTAITKLYQIASSTNTNDHDQKYARAVMLDLYDRQQLLSSSNGLFLKAGLLILSVATGLFLGV